ncbi:hypothetical protein B1H19_02070 [Streptomyces gilvosporeus]|uniref:DUF4132 domain-containing protein n=2 Tax=Streptomyces gilvosporeus TaxID=553510 RepID=A0A1V0TJL6_9ACTN|nr:hypothetical protein B1H19_02070 [Streptomyces gilvosporeus]
MAGPPPDLGTSGGAWAACARLTPLELGALLPAAYRTLADEDAHEHARRIAREITWATTQPAFTAASLADFYAALAVAPKPTDVCYAAGALLRCTDRGIEEGGRSALAAPAAALVSAATATEAVMGDHIAGAALAVSAVAGPAVEAELVARLRTECGNSPLRLAELDVMLTADAMERAWIAEDCRYPSLTGTWPPLTDRLVEYTPSPSFAELARRTLHSAADHLAALHTGRVPYAADKAFTPADTETLRRAARLALRHDEPWTGEVLATLLPRLAVAPTAARTLPSQGACIVLAQAVETYPTPESVAALREAHRVVRHAGVRKKLDRLLSRAERNLAKRPGTLLRLPDLGYGPDGTRRIPCGDCTAVLTAAPEPTLTWERADGRPLRALPAAARRDHPEEVTAAREVLRTTRAQTRTLLRGLEGGYREGTVYRFERWRDSLATHPVARGAVRRLIWEIEYAPGDWRATLPEADRPLDPEPAPSAAVRLWHPARATDTERRLWRDRIADLRLHQPFRQAFREHYVPDVPDLPDLPNLLGLPEGAPSPSSHSTDMFRGHLVRIETVLGLAARQGWRIDDDELALSLPEVTAYFGLAAKLYPGASGWAETEDVRLVRAGGGGPQPLRGLDAVKRSEILRAVDLLVSASSYAWHDTDGDTAAHLRGRSAFDRDARQQLDRLHALPLGQTAQLRREALHRIFAGHLSSGRVEFGARHLRLDGYAIHLATGRVTRDGDPVDIAVPKGRTARPLPFLPYDEQLLERIVRTAEELIARVGTGPSDPPS